jgi:hypothetical protein
MWLSAITPHAKRQRGISGKAAEGGGRLCSASSLSHLITLASVFYLPDDMDINDTESMDTGHCAVHRATQHITYFYLLKILKEDKAAS